MRWILIIVFVACSYAGFSQGYVISNPKENVIYIGIPNPLNVAVEGRYCKDIVLSTDNGKIEAAEEKCSYTIYPENAGKTEIVIKDKRKHTIIGSVDFRTKYIPDPVAMVGGKNGGEIRKSILRVQLGITAILQNFDFDARFAISGFTMTILRSDRTVFSKTCEGALFPQEIRNAFEMLQTNDRVLFSDISCKAPDGRARRLQPIEFRIID